MQTNSNFHREFWNEVWSEHSHMKECGPTSRHVRRLIKNVIATLNFHSVLDVGCGEGTLLKEIADWKRGIEVFGTDISEKAVEYAISRIAGDFRVVDILKETLPREFDLVICSEVLEHLEDDVQALINIRKMVGKYLVVLVPLEQGADICKSVGHVQSYTKEAFLQKMRDANFEILSAKKWGFPFYSPIYRKLLRVAKKDMAAGEFGVFKRMISSLLYYMFMFNIKNRGGKLIVLATVK